MTRRDLFRLGAGLAASPRARGGLLETTLEAKPSAGIIAGRTVSFYGYNGLMPGPVLEARPGDTVRVRLINSLPEPTNLHFHGLHVSPSGNSDNPFLHVPSGEELDYELRIPKTHPGGTFWYHPHVHESTARQVFRGLSGLLLIRGEMDKIPEIAAAAEVTLVLKDFTFNGTGSIPEPGFMTRVNGREGSLLTVNGLRNPRIRLAPQSLTRLRILNASSSRYYRLRLEDHPLAVIAVDGGPLPATTWVDEYLLVPGQRVEFLVKGDRGEGIYRLLNLPYDRGGMGMMGVNANSTRSDTLAEFAYEGFAGSSPPVPEILADSKVLPEPVGPGRTLTLTMSMMTFGINGRGFDPSRADTVVNVGTVEDWTIVNPGPMDHPFHIHTNSFQLPDNEDLPAAAWHDVVNVPSGSRRRIRIPFADFNGLTVYHCHILDHEDLGMMGTLRMAS
jgi:FtsP/CotA-like multicopper oxidase with cupredoxin domain